MMHNALEVPEDDAQCPEKRKYNNIETTIYLCSRRNAMSCPGVPGSKTIAKQKAKAKAKQNQQKQQQILTGTSIIIVMQ